MISILSDILQSRNVAMWYAGFTTSAYEFDEANKAVTHHPAISISVSFQHPFNRAGGSTFNVRHQMKISLIMSILVVQCLTPSCSNAIYENAPYSKVLRSRSTQADIRSALGQPVQTGLTTKKEGSYYAGRPYDRFVVRGTVYDREMADMAAVGTVMSFGISGITMLPDAIQRSSKKGNTDVFVIYDENKHYLHHRVGGAIR